MTMKPDKKEYYLNLGKLQNLAKMLDDDLMELLPKSRIFNTCDYDISIAYGCLEENNNTIYVK